MDEARGSRHHVSWLDVVAGLLFAVAVWPALHWYGRRVTDGSDDPLGPLALVAAAWMLWRQRTEVRWHPMRLLAGAVVLAVIRWVYPSLPPMLQAFAALIVWGMSVYPVRSRSGYVSLLVLSLPLVASLNFYLGYSMRLSAAEVAAGFWSMCGWDVIRQGVLLVDGGRAVGVDPACAGVTMLWAGLFAAAFLAARQRTALVRTILWLGLAWLMVIAGNVLRVTILFLPESGRVHWPHWTHEAVGLASYALMLTGIIACGNWLSEPAHRQRSARLSVWSILARMGPLRKSVVAAGIVLFVAMAAYAARPLAAGSSEQIKKENSWPATLDGIPLEPLPLTSKEEAFLFSFPGQVARFRAGQTEVILRKVYRPTRLLHSSADCLRASGYAIQHQPMQQDDEGKRWQEFRAQSITEQFTVRERIISTTGQSYTDVSAWYWNATLGKDSGPWLAMTVSEK